MSHEKIGRNAFCPCGSGLKYKKCCLAVSAHTTIPADDSIQMKQSLQKLEEKIKTNWGKRAEIKTKPVPVKMSEVILEFADDLLERTHNNSQRKKAVQLACLAWNLALVEPREKIESELEKFLHSMGLKKERDQKDIKHIIWSLIEKKWSHQYFASIDRLIVDYEIDDSRNDFVLNVASTVPA